MGITFGHSNTTARAGQRGLLALAGLATVLLAACAEKELILPGKREPLEAALLSSQEAEDLRDGAGDIGSAPISLPPAVANASAPQGAGSPAFRTDHPSLGTTLTQVWSVSIGAGDSRKHRIVAAPVVADGRIYTLDAQSTVTAVSTSGAVLWQRDIRPEGAEEGDATGGGLAVHDGTLFISTGFGALTALEAATGRTRWVQDLDGTSSGRPTAVGDLVYVLGGDDTGWAVNTADGRVAWEIAGAESQTNVLGAPAPIVTDGLAIFAFGSGEMQAVFQRGGLRRWDASVLGERRGRALAKFGDVTGDPIAVDGVIYAGNQSGRTVAVDAGSGRRIWTVDEGAIDAVLPVGGSVFFVSDRNELIRVDASDGARVWGTQLPNFVKTRGRRQSEVFAHHGPVLAGGRLLVASSDGVLRSFDPVNGNLIGTTEVADGASTTPVIAGRTLYVVSRKGNLIAYR